MPDESNGWDYTEPDWSVREPAGAGRVRPTGGLSGLFLLLVVALIAWGALTAQPVDGQPYQEPPACGRDWPPTCDQEPRR